MGHLQVQHGGQAEQQSAHVFGGICAQVRVHQMHHSQPADTDPALSTLLLSTQMLIGNVWFGQGCGSPEAAEACDWAELGAGYDSLKGKVCSIARHSLFWQARSPGNIAGNFASNMAQQSVSAGLAHEHMVEDLALAVCEALAHPGASADSP